MISGNDRHRNLNARQAAEAPFRAETVGQRTAWCRSCAGAAQGARTTRVAGLTTGVDSSGNDRFADRYRATGSARPLQWRPSSPRCPRRLALPNRVRSEARTSVLSAP